MPIARFAALAGVAAFLLETPAGSAQVPAPPPPTFGPLSVKATFDHDGTTYLLATTIVCVGSAANPEAYGSTLTNSSGIATFANVPLGTPMYVTVQSKQVNWIGGQVQGKRINYVAKASGLTVPIALVVSSQPAPLCTTPIGQEPTPIPTKTMPSPTTDVPAITAPLLTFPGPVTTQSHVEIHTHGTSTRYIAVSGVPTHFALSGSPQAAPTWHPVTSTGYDRIDAIGVNVAPGDGTKTAYLKLKNSAGESPQYQVNVMFIDPSPCVLELTQHTGPQAGASTSTVTHTIRRGQSKGWAGDGRLVRTFANEGPHPIGIGYFQAGSDGSSVGPPTTMSLGAGGASTQGTPLRNIVSATCP
jgi:hypothetical protein